MPGPFLFAANVDSTRHVSDCAVRQRGGNNTVFSKEVYHHASADIMKEEQTQLHSKK